MSCILCFLEDQLQDELRLLSQSKSHRFEDVLKEYQNNFINQFFFLTDTNQCNKHSNIHHKTQDEANNLYKNLKTSLDLISFINKTRNIYETWIGGSNSEAALAFKNLLREYDILKKSNRIDKSIFFRGRKSPNPLTQEDLFHIPFNKRYLIQNQRYSITGQPLLYLGLSPLDVVAEIRGNIDTLENIYFSSFVHKSEKTLSVFDITNQYQDLFSTHNILSNDEMEAPAISSQVANSDFYTFVLSQMCSFKRSTWSEKSVFSEEYVLPQLLTEVLNKSEFDGILFSSTRVDYKKISSDTTFHVNRYRENVALFTSYNNEHNYDVELYNQFTISKPITIDEIVIITIDDLISLRKEVFKDIPQERRANIGPANIVEITGVRTQTLFENLFIHNATSKTSYFTHDIGKIHLHFLYQILLDTRNRLYNRLKTE